MRHAVHVSRLSGSRVLSPRLRALMKRSVRAVLASEDIDTACEVNILYTDDGGIRSLNRRCRGVDRATDVLSFPFQELSPGGKPVRTDGGPDVPVWLGDIVVSLERMESQAGEFGHSEEREAAFLIAHACLHLLGYDHERGPEEERIMFDKTERILEGMGLPKRETFRKEV